MYRCVIVSKNKNSLTRSFQIYTFFFYFMKFNETAMMENTEETNMNAGFLVNICRLCIFIQPAK